MEFAFYVIHTNFSIPIYKLVSEIADQMPFTLLLQDIVNAYQAFMIS
jgi:hypothetical protein